MAQTTTLNFNVIGQSLERLDDNRIVEKAKNYVEAQFSFNEVWENTTKAILIEGSNLKYKAYLNEENKCLIPNRVVRHDGFTLTVVGEDSEKYITITTNDLFIPILSNNVTDDTPSYVEEIESETLDVTRHGEKYNLEIPDNYITNTKLSQELENYVDNESLEETLEDYVKETDLSDYATKQELNGKSTVIPNPTMSGDEPNLEGAEIDGIKYKVGGGGKSYLHKISITFSLIAYGNLGQISLLITNSNNTPIGKEFFRNTLGYDTSNNLCYITGFIDNITSSSSYKDKYIVIGFYVTSNWQLGIRLLGLSDLSIVNVNSYYSNITDTITEE